MADFEHGEPLPDESKGLNGEVIRDYVPKAGVPWRHGKPNYVRVNKAYFEGRTKTHPEGSLEKVVQTLVKNWEVEAHHIADTKFWQTMNVDKFQLYANDLRCPFSAAMTAERGPYNLLLGKHELYNADAHDYDSANEIFKTCFDEGFPWEVLEIHSGPPAVSFTWRHWGKFSGPYTAPDGTVYPPTNEQIEMFGMCVARVDANLKIDALELFYDREAFLQQFIKGTA